MLIDSHVHIDFYNNPQSMISNLAKNNIKALFVTHLPELYLKYFKSGKYKSEYIDMAVGFHPILIDEYPFSTKSFCQAIETTDFIGEVGLDYSVIRSETGRKKQREVFDNICRNSDNRVLSIHSRQAENDCIQIMSDNGIKNAIFHWYSGKEDLVESILNLGYYFSINPTMLNSTKGRNILRLLPMDRILIETDGPFTKYNATIISPEYLSDIYGKFEKFYGTFNLLYQIEENYKHLQRLCANTWLAV